MSDSTDKPSPVSDPEPVVSPSTVSDDNDSPSLVLPEKPHDPARIKKVAFLSAFRKCGNITSAARACGIDRSSHYQWLAQAEYAEAFTHALDDATDELEAVARERATAGSDLLLIFLLKALRPKVYREKVEHTGPDGGPITIEHLAPQMRRIEDG